MAYNNPKHAEKRAPQQQAAKNQKGADEGGRFPSFHVVLADAEGELVSWEQIGSEATTLSTEVKKYGDQRNASVGAIWMAESGNSGFLRIGDLTFKVFPAKKKEERAA